MPAEDPGKLVAVLLCGGRGMRAWPLTEEIPKPLLPVGGGPALGQLVEIYARQGIRRFVMATGYKGEAVARWAASAAFSVDVDVRCVDTGEDSNTGERVRRCADEVGDRFLVTYGDGLGNVDLRALLRHHEAAAATGTLCTLTTVPLPSQYGTLELSLSDQVTGFREKPTLADHWINAGFFAFERAVFEDWPGPDLERDVLPALAAAGRLQAYRHPGFWKSMDTQKDVADLDRLATEGGGAPWLDLPTSRS
ncbi:MAG: glucose-phosphate cytidylyltransferase [Frankiales bacterium]|nr:glucose-phosphate cytidylyltransferase [Frankiales bacterium]